MGNSECIVKRVKETAFGCYFQNISCFSLVSIRNIVKEISNYLWN